MVRPWELLRWNRLWGHVPSGVAGGPMLVMLEEASSLQHPPSLAAAQPPRCKCHEGSRHLLPFFFLFKSNIYSPSHPRLPMENLIHFP